MSRFVTVEKIDTDILIIGSGGSGLRAAIAATEKGGRVLVVAKEFLKDAHTGWAMGGLNVAIKAPATSQMHFEDTINGGWFINNYKLARIFAEEMPDRIRDLERYGVKFDRLPDGSYFTWAGGKQSAPLNLCAGDYTGREMMQGLLAEVERLDIPYLEHHYVTKLIKRNDKVAGAFLIDRRTGTYRVVQAKATIVATGGGGNMYKINTNAPSNTGEGYAWASDMGAELVADVFAAHMEVGIDVRKQMMEVTPSMHHMMGGYAINEWGETNVDGLYAVGEVTTSVHGANRLGGNSLAEGQVFGRRAGMHAAEYVKGSRSPEITRQAVDAEVDRVEAFLRRNTGQLAAEVLSKIKTVMWNNVGITRDADSLLTAKREIKQLQHEAQFLLAEDKSQLQACLETQDMLKTAEVIILAALERKESRGAHYRSDYPQLAPAWEKNIRIYKDKAGKLVTRIIPPVKD